MTVARHYIVHGRVQGVGFRAWTRDTATSLGLTGWVRNRKDGTVEAVIEGDTDAVSRMHERLGRGPGSADVQKVEMQETDPAQLVDFEIRR